MFSIFAGRDVKRPGPPKLCTEERKSQTEDFSKFYSISRSNEIAFTDQDKIDILKGLLDSTLLTYEIHFIKRRYTLSWNVVVSLKVNNLERSGPTIKIYKKHACKILPLTLTYECLSLKVNWPPSLVLLSVVVDVHEGELLGLLLVLPVIRHVTRVCLWVRCPKNTKMIVICPSLSAIYRPDSSPPPEPDGTEHRDSDQDHKSKCPGHSHYGPIGGSIAGDRHLILTSVASMRNKRDVSNTAIVLTLMKRYVRPQTNDQCIQKSKVDQLVMTPMKFADLKLYFLIIVALW